MLLRNKGNTAAKVTISSRGAVANPNGTTAALPEQDPLFLRGFRYAF